MMTTPNVVNGLEQITCYGTTPPAPPPTMAPSFMMASPVSYQFQVVEYTDVNGDDVVVKVELQVQQTTHDQYGNVKYSSGFKPVPRIRLPLVV